MGAEEEFEYSCSICSAEVEKSDKICPNCGADLTEIDFEIVKIRGWLLFFCINLTIIAPIIYGAQMLNFSNVLLHSPEYTPRYVIITLLNIVLITGLTIFGIISGISLWQIKPNAVRFTKIYLGTYLIISLLQALIDLAIGDQEIGTDLLRAFVFVGIWYNYLTSSVRVRNTYDS